MSENAPEKTEEKTEEKEEGLPATKAFPLETMKALLLQALLGSNLEPLLKGLDQLGRKIEILAAEMKTRNDLEVQKMSYNKALDKARALIKMELRKSEETKNVEKKK